MERRKFARNGITAFPRMKGDTLIIWKLDRASRSMKHLIELAEDWKKRGIELLSLKEKIDTSTAPRESIATVRVRVGIATIL
ncbi:MAG: recombinase family protein [Cyanobacteria bacterium J06626_14]